jgi:hypothetical protein
MTPLKKIFQVSGKKNKTVNIIVIKRSCLGQATASLSSNAQVTFSFHKNIKPVNTSQSLFQNNREENSSFKS